MTGSDTNTKGTTMTIVDQLRNAGDDAMMNIAQAAVAMNVCYSQLNQVLRDARIISPYYRGKGPQEFRLGDAKKAWESVA